MKKIYQWEHEGDTYRLVNTEYGHVLEVLKKDALGADAWLRKATLVDPCEGLLCAAIEQLVGERILTASRENYLGEADAETWYTWSPSGFKQGDPCGVLCTRAKEEAIRCARNAGNCSVFEVDGEVGEDNRSIPGAKLGRLVWEPVFGERIR